MYVRCVWVWVYLGVYVCGVCVWGIYVCACGGVCGCVYVVLEEVCICVCLCVCVWYVWGVYVRGV